MVLAVLAGGTASAGIPDGFAIDLFEPQPVQGRSVLGVSTARVLENAQVSFGLFGHYQDDPLTAVSFDDRNQVTARLVDSRWTAELLAAVGLFDYFELGLAMPFVVAQTGDDLGAIGRANETVGGFALGDLRIVPKVRILGGAARLKPGIGVHLAVPIAVPTGSTKDLASDGGARVTPTLGFEYAFEGGVLAANVGYTLRSKAELATYTSGNGLRWSVGARAPLVAGRLAVLASVQGSLTLADQPVADAATTPIEVLAGLEADAGSGLVVSAGAGLPVLRGVGSPDVRAFLAITWTPPKPAEVPDRVDEHKVDGHKVDEHKVDEHKVDEHKVDAPDTDADGLADAKDKCKDFAEDKDGFQDDDGCPDPDNDIDGVPDESDKCPDLPEDYNGPEDGCPNGMTPPDPAQPGPPTVAPGPGPTPIPVPTPGPGPTPTPAAPDADADGIPDATDRCPDDAEDKDGDADEDGCPDVDADGDGVDPDACPNEPEDIDGFEDADGCPEPGPDAAPGDADADGIPDATDKCPSTPESKNGRDDDDGCPDTLEKDLVLTENGIAMKQQIAFGWDSDQIRDKSYPLVDAIARVLAENPFITRLSIEGHTDSEGPEERNLDLSTRRAASVRQYLIAHGVAPERLLSTGWGESRPLKPNTTPQGRAANRRVELKIIAISGRPVTPGTP